MSNLKPDITKLQQNRGQKTKIGRKEFTVKLLPEEKKRVEMIAEAFGLTHGNKGSISALLNAIADCSLMVIQTPPIQPLEIAKSDDNKTVLVYDQKNPEEFLEQLRKLPKLSSGDGSVSKAEPLHAEHI